MPSYLLDQLIKEIDMAGQSTALTEFSSSGNSRTSTTSGHTVSKPKLVIERRRVPSGKQVVSEYSFTVLQATEDADGNVLEPKVQFVATVKQPINGDSADVAAALVIFRDIVAGDEFGNSVTTSEWL
jgi:hypothetical protein